MTPAATDTATPLPTQPSLTASTGVAPSAPVSGFPILAIRISAGILLIISAAWLAVRSFRPQKMNDSENDAAEAEWSYDI
jgi:hypothetical protein